MPQRDSPQGAATLNQPSRPQPAQTQMQTPQSSQAPSTTLTSQPASFPAYPSPSHVPKAPAQIQQSPTQLQPSAPVRLQPQQAVQPQYESCPQAVPLQPPQTPQPAPVQPAQPALQTLPQQPQQQHPGGLPRSVSLHILSVSGCCDQLAVGKPGECIGLEGDMFRESEKRAAVAASRRSLKVQRSSNQAKTAAETLLLKTVHPEANFRRWMGEFHAFSSCLHGTHILRQVAKVNSNIQ